MGKRKREMMKEREKREIILKVRYVPLISFRHFVHTRINSLVGTGVGKCNLLKMKFTPVITLLFAN